VSTVIEVQGLRKAYGGLEALAGIDLRVERGEVFAFLGPNGAGKTTTVEILEGYRHPTAGEIEVLGADPRRAGHDWRQRIGIVLQECRMEPVLSVRETLSLYAGYYRAPRDVDETIDLVGLAASADVRAGKLSGGQQRRLDVALALIGDAELLFLDEPTTGFDPSARRQAWDVIAALRELGKTVFLTTHYMDEAQFLADRVAIIRGGRIVAEGAPDLLGGRADAATRITFAPPPGFDADTIPAAAGALAPSIGNGAVVELSTADPVRSLNALTGWALEQGIELRGLEVSRPTLEDVYLELTREASE
jgi:ABC-2 type transport system ATP-binding protein